MMDIKDFSYLSMAYALAEKAKGQTSPNPYVGAVVVKKDIIVGYGYHEGPGKPHAEAVALQRAASRSKDSTLYTTLEPCVHWGRTPPCVESIIQAGLKRVVVSSLDPNPLVLKKGIKKLEEAGIEVSVGLLEEKNKGLNECYYKYITKKIPFVIGKAAVSLDGKIATKTYSSQWISSPETREYIHLLRGEYDALLVGIHTLLKDDPQLSVRHRNWKRKRITRVILDSRLRFPLQAKILSTLDRGNILVFTSEKAPKKKADALQKKGAEVIFLSSSFPFVDLREVLKTLGKREVASVLVEGGGRVLTSAIEQKLVDKIILTISPKLIGGERAPSLFQGEGAESIKESLSLKRINYFRLNEDIILEGYL